ncbi:hypothetical protein, partial [Crocosphaera sp. Alani8]|uniref:hypothetical protein n=1 Tax=Crocosphaera sp. Alani8 TaxID=3038952 RepID=UPI00313D0D17
MKVRCLKQRSDAKAKKGIENLIPNELFTKDFYTKKTVEGDYGEEKEIENFEKTDFCKWICEERRNANDFIHFEEIVDILKLLKKSGGTRRKLGDK